MSRSNDLLSTHTKVINCIELFQEVAVQRQIDFTVCILWKLFYLMKSIRLIAGRSAGV